MGYRIDSKVSTQRSGSMMRPLTEVANQLQEPVGIESSKGLNPENLKAGTGLKENTKPNFLLLCISETKLRPRDEGLVERLVEGLTAS